MVSISVKSFYLNHTVTYCMCAVLEILRMDSLNSVSEGKFLVFDFQTKPEIQGEIPLDITQCVISKLSICQ